MTIHDLGPPRLTTRPTSASVRVCIDGLDVVVRVVGTRYRRCRQRARDLDGRSDRGRWDPRPRAGRRRVPLRGGHHPGSHGASYVHGAKADFVTVWSQPTGQARRPLAPSVRSPGGRRLHAATDRGPQRAVAPAGVECRRGRPPPVRPRGHAVARLLDLHSGVRTGRLRGPGSMPPGHSCVTVRAEPSNRRARIRTVRVRSRVGRHGTVQERIEAAPGRRTGR